jgi:hypothetical protein
MRGQDYAYQQPSLTHKKLRLSRSAPALRHTRGPPPGPGRRARSCAPQRSSSPRRPRPPTDAASATGTPHRQRGRAPARHRGAHLKGRQAAKQRGRTQPQVLRFSSSSTDAHRDCRKHEGVRPARPWSDIRRPQQQPASIRREYRVHAEGEAPGSAPNEVCCIRRGGSSKAGAHGVGVRRARSRLNAGVAPSPGCRPFAGHRWVLRHSSGGSRSASQRADSPGRGRSVHARRDFVCELQSSLSHSKSFRPLYASLVQWSCTWYERGPIAQLVTLEFGEPVFVPIAYPS